MHAGVLRDIALEEKEKAEAEALAALAVLGKTDNDVTRVGEEDALRAAAGESVAQPVPANVVTPPRNHNVPAKKILVAPPRAAPPPAPVMECEGDICKLSTKRMTTPPSLK
jgi:hypothetical protein